MALVTVRAARGVESISDDALPQTASPPTPLVVAESLNDVVRHARVALVWIIVQAAAILDHEPPAFGRQPAAPLRAALDRTSVLSGPRVSVRVYIGVRGIIKKNKT